MSERFLRVDDFLTVIGILITIFGMAIGLVYKSVLATSSSRQKIWARLEALRLEIKHDMEKK